MTKSKYYYIRLAARIFGLIICLFYLYVSKGDFMKVFQGDNIKVISFFPFVGVAVAGYLISYVQERKGGYLMLIGGIALVIFFLVTSHGADWARAAVFGIPFILCGVAFVYGNQQE